MEMLNMALHISTSINMLSMVHGTMVCKCNIQPRYNLPSECYVISEDSMRCCLV